MNQETLTFTEAALAVLKDAGEPLHYRKITELAIRRQLLSHVGKNPEVTMSSRLATLVRKDRGQALIVKVKPGVFALREFAGDVDPEIESSESDMDALAQENGAQQASSPLEMPAPELREAVTPPSYADVFPEEDDDDEPIFGGGRDKEGDSVRPEGEASERRRRKRGGRRRSGLLETEGADGASSDDEPADTAEAGASARRSPERGNARGRDGSEDASRRGREGRGGTRSPREASASREGGGTRNARNDRQSRSESESSSRGNDAGRSIDVGRQPQAAPPRAYGTGLSLAMRVQLTDAEADPLAVATCELLAEQGAAHWRDLAASLVERGDLSGPPRALASTVAASLRGTNARLTGRQRPSLFRETASGEIRGRGVEQPHQVERQLGETERTAQRQRAAAGRALLDVFERLPIPGRMELFASWLAGRQVAELRALRVPGLREGDFHLVGTRVLGLSRRPIALVLTRGGRRLEQEDVIATRGALHHFEGASEAWIITTGEVSDAAVAECASGSGVCVLFDGASFAADCLKLRIGLQEVQVPVAMLDVAMLEALGMKPFAARDREAVGQSAARDEGARGGATGDQGAAVEGKRERGERAGAEERDEASGVRATRSGGRGRGGRGRGQGATDRSQDGSAAQPTDAESGANARTSEAGDVSEQQADQGSVALLDSAGTGAEHANGANVVSALEGESEASEAGAAHGSESDSKSSDRTAAFSSAESAEAQRDESRTESVERQEGRTRDADGQASDDIDVEVDDAENAGHSNGGDGNEDEDEDTERSQR